MSKAFEIFFLLLFVEILSVSSQNNGSITTVPSADIPSDGTGIIKGQKDNSTSDNSTSNNPSNNQTAEDSPGVNSNDTSLTVTLGNSLSSVSGLLGFVLNWTLVPVFDLLWFLLSPVLLLVRGILSPILTLVNYLLGMLGLPPLGDLLESLLKTLIGWLATILANVAALINGILGGQPSTQQTRRRRAITDSLMAPIMAPFQVIYDVLMLPYQIMSTLYNILSMPFWVMSYPYSWMSSAAGAPFSMGYDMLTWPIRQFFYMLGLGGDGQFDDIDGLDANSTGNATERQAIMDEMIGAMSEGAQQALAQGLGEGFKILKNDILPALDSTAQAYQDSNIIPDSLKTYLRSFHQAYNMLQMLRVL